MSAILCIISILFSGCSAVSFWQRVNDDTLALPEPVITPAVTGTVFEGPQQISISSSEEGVTFTYTTDGSNPKTSSTAMTGDLLTIQNSAWVRAYASKQGRDDSPVTSAGYTIRHVYVAGGQVIDVDASPGEYATYWKNGEDHAVAQEESYAYGLDISSTGEAYMCGKYFTGINYEACYWIDGIKQNNLSRETGTQDSIATDIVVLGNDVYISGYYTTATETIACYWVNGAITSLDTGGSTELKSSALCVDGSTIYSAGYYVSAGHKRACYWNGTTKIDLVHPDAATGDAEVLDITFQNGTLYTCGYFLTAPVHKTGKTVFFITADLFILKRYT
jgi:hypothetical protein